MSKNRRDILSTTGVLASAVAATFMTTNASAQANGRLKLTTLYGTPKNPEEFEKEYLGTLIPLVAAIKGIPRFEASKSMAQSDGSAPAFYRVFEAWFDSTEQMNAVFKSPEWAKIKEIAGTIATGGVTRVISKLD
jgi:uncharacterized protein (TIGR02118 family)